MIKIGSVNDFAFRDPPVSIVKVSSKGPDSEWFEKRGSWLTDERATLKPVKGHTPILLFPLGAMEYLSANRNADAFPATKCAKVIKNPSVGNSKIVQIKRGLLENHPTFVSHGKVYAHHINKDPKHSEGFIHSTRYNEPMGRVEAIAYVDNEKWASELSELDTGKPTSVSMSCAVEYDICSYCGNKSTNSKDYCGHINSFKNAVLQDGHQVVMINENPVFKDLSRVTRNADRIAFGLGKITLDGDTEKKASWGAPSDIHLYTLLEKLAEIEKEITCGNEDLSNLSRAVDKRDQKDIPKKDIQVIEKHSPGSVIKLLSVKRILLPPRQFFRVTTGDDFDSIESMLPQIIGALPGIFGRMLDKQPAPTTLRLVMPDSSEKADTMSMRSIIGGMRPEYSMLEPKLRVVISIANHKDSPKIKLSPEKTTKEASALAESYGKYLLTTLEDEEDALRVKLAVLSNYVSDE